MQDGRSTREQRRRRLTTLHFTCQIARYNGVDSAGRDGAKFDSDMLTNAVPLRHQSRRK